MWRKRVRRGDCTDNAPWEEAQLTLQYSQWIVMRGGTADSAVLTMDRIRWLYSTHNESSWEEAQLTLQYSQWVAMRGGTADSTVLTMDRHERRHSWLYSTHNGSPWEEAKLIFFTGQSHSRVEQVREAQPALSMTCAFFLEKSCWFFFLTWFHFTWNPGWW
jgi:hypothetical protein